MREWLVLVTENAIVIIDTLALVVIVVGTVEACVRSLRLLVSPPSGQARREVGLLFARWLVAGLTFQLAADIAETAIATSWDALGRLAAVAVIRTFLNYFLEHDLSEMRDRRHGTGT